MKTEILEYQITQQSNCKIVFSQDNDCFVKQIKSLKINKRIIIITTKTLENSHAKNLATQLKKTYKVTTISLPDGEQTKNTTQLIELATHCLNIKIERNDTLIACGGGVIGDITGFLASILLRGINFIQYPTTLLSQVDAAIGGKTGVNHESGKNLIGTFYQPKLVWINIKTLSTLPKREWLSGLAEIIKYGIIQDKTIFELIEKNTQKLLNFDIQKETELWTTLIKQSIKIKTKIVEADEKESGVRTILNLGHTIGHAIETLSNYNTYSHGQAVVFGTICATYLSHKLEFINKEETEKIYNIYKKLNYKTKLDTKIDPEKIYNIILNDKKIKKGIPNFVLPIKIGSVKTTKVPNKEMILNTIKYING